MPIHIVRITLKIGKEEILFTNAPQESAIPIELKELYGKRWTTKKTSTD